MKNIYKFIILCFSFLLFSWVNANSLDFYWEKDSSWDILNTQNIEKLNTQLNQFYNNTWLNTDIIILWKWDSCYLNNNFDSCIRDRESYSSDLVLVLSMKSDIKTRWDIRTLIKDEFKESITPWELKKLQDTITHYFWNKNFTTWIIEYLWKINNLISSKCREVWIKDECDAVKLSREYHSYVATKEYEAKYNAMMKNIYYIIGIISIILSYLWLRKFYINSLKNLHKDTKYKITSLSEFEIFKKDREYILNSLEWLEKHLKIKLWDLNKNAFTLKSFYKKQKNVFKSINNELSEMQKSYLNREKLKEKIEKIKSIDL